MNIQLGPFQLSDVTDTYLEAIQGEQAKYLWTGEREWTMKLLKEYVESVLIDPNQHMFAVYDSDRHIGNIKITFDEKNRRASYGRLMWKKGTGAGTEALRLMIRYVFETYPNIDAIMDMAAQGNIASIVSNMKAGMSIRGIWKDALCIGGKRVDGVPVGITREEWEAHQAEKEEDEIWNVNF